MDEISQEPRWDFRLPPRRWLAALAVLAAAVAAGLLVASTGGHHAAPPPHLVVAPPPPPPPSAAPGTVLLTCNSANWGQLDPGWQATSLHAGPLWFANSREGYVHHSRSPGEAQPPRGRATMEGDVMIVEVADGPAVVTMKPTARAWSYLHFSWAAGSLPAGDNGFTFAPCPRSQPGPNGEVTDFYLGFSIAAGSAAPVEVSTSGSRHLAWLTFTAPEDRP